MLSPLPELRGSQTPRIRSAPPSSYSLADEVLDLVMLAGRIHIPWQAAATTDIMACRSDGKWAAKEVGLLVARQNGKSAVVENVELGWMVFEPGVQILHTAHEMPAALESMRKLIALFDGHRDLRKLIAPRGIRKRGGEEGVTLRNGSRILFRSRTDSAGRSFSGERIVYDEAMIITPESENALSNILTTAKNPQTLYIGSAADIDSMPHCHKWDGLRERGKAGEDPSLLWIEYSCPPDVDESDPQAWAQANPSLGYITTEEFVADQYRSQKDRNLKGFRTERLSIWNGPKRSEGEHAHVINMDAVRDAVVDRSLSPRLTDRRALGVARDWRGEVTAVAAAVYTDDGRIFVERGRVAEPNTQADVQFLVSCVDAFDPVAIAIDSGSPADVLTPHLVAKKIEPVRTTTAQMGQACLGLKTGFEEGEIVHLGDKALMDILNVVEKRNIGRTGAWAFEWDCQENIALLVAVTLAVWALVTKGQAQATPPAGAPESLAAADEDDSVTGHLAAVGF